MKVDFHFHLEEGPYSYNWLMRTAQAIENTTTDGAKGSEPRNTLQWMNKMTDLLQERMENGCFSDDWIERYMAVGKERGISQFGIVDHLYRFKEFRPYYEKYILLDDSDIGRKQQYWLDRVCTNSIEDYLPAVRRVQAKGYLLSVGVEADYFPGGEKELGELLGRYSLDYVIGSIHFMDGWGFDNPDTKELFEGKDLVALYRRLFEHVKMAAESGLFDIIAHLDNLKVFNYRPDEALLLDMYEDVAAALKKAGVASEINTGLAYRYPVKEACPSPSLLRALFAHGVPITLSSDAHFPDDLGTMLDDARSLAMRTGYTHIVGFKNKERYTIPLDD